MERRTFLRLSGVGVFSIGMQTRAMAAGSTQKPNILIVMTDQQFSDGMSCVMGHKYLNTPHMDALVSRGMRFTRAYSPNPLCMPMRASMITGHYPHQTGVQTNSKDPANVTDFMFMGKIFKNAGYETGYFGKWHIAVKSDKKEIHGFDEFTDKSSRRDPSRAVEFIKRPHNRPFLAFASFLGPHEICEWARKEDIPGKQLPSPPPVDERPPVVKNAAPPKHETDIMAHMRKSYQADRLFPVGNYTKADWRRQIWGYYRLIERVDGYIGAVLTALHESGHEDNTVVVFLSDHGECHGAHLWNQKTVFYDESSRVPFVISWKGKTPRGESDVLINTGTDLLPTICDFAGIEPPEGLPGKSLKALALGGKPSWKREYVVSENHMVQCQPVDGLDLKPNGRMVRSKRYKYCLYSEGQQRESLVDMDTDPGEMVNQAENPKFRKVLNQHRGFLKEHAKRYNDTLALEMLGNVT